MSTQNPTQCSKTDVSAWETESNDELTFKPSVSANRFLRNWGQDYKNKQKLYIEATKKAYLLSKPHIPRSALAPRYFKISYTLATILGT